MNDEREKKLQEGERKLEERKCGRCKSVLPKALAPLVDAAGDEICAWCRAKQTTGNLREFAKSSRVFVQTPLQRLHQRGMVSNTTLIDEVSRACDMVIALDPAKGSDESAVILKTRRGL